MQPKIFDYHTHTCLSDGVLGPIELIRFAVDKGYDVIAVTDHVSVSTMERVIREVRSDCLLAEKYWKVTAVPGVEFTHVPAGAIGDLARRARELGAELVVIHGETVVEPVEPGTNLAAVQSPDVDILAHPGLITFEEAKLAAQNDICLEITSRRGHSLTNGHVVKTAKAAGAPLLVNSDTHEPEDLHTSRLIQTVAAGAGLTPEETQKVIDSVPRKLLTKILAGRNGVR